MSEEVEATVDQIPETPLEPASEAAASVSQPASEPPAQVARKKKRRPLRAITIALGIIAGVLVVAVVGANVFVCTVYAGFYDNASQALAIPGISQGFVPQDLDYFDKSSEWLFSGYMDDGSPSPIYRSSNRTATVRFTVQEPDGTIYDGHGSGITSNSDNVFLTCEGGYLVFAADDIANVPDGGMVRAIGEVDLEFSPAFLNIENSILYAGNFYFPEKYETPAEHRIFTSDGNENPAVMYAYPRSNDARFGYGSQAVCVYSIPAMVQGMCTTPSGQMVFSTSYGLRSSRLLFFDVGLLEQNGTFHADGRDVPLYVFDTRSLTGSVEAPPMTEGIESHDERIYIAEESASNKYFFGKLYGAGIVYALRPL